MASLFNFVEKEGKFFTPITYDQDRIEVVNGRLERQGTKIAAGTKGVYARVRFTLPTTGTTPESLRFSGEDVSPCWVEYVTANWVRVPENEVAALQFTPVGYWRGSVRNRPAVITPESGVPVWTANVRGVDNYIFYIETDLETTDGFALGQPGLSIAHSATGFRSRNIEERILWTPSCDLIGRNALIGNITQETGPSQQRAELFAVNTEFFGSSN